MGLIIDVNMDHHVSLQVITKVLKLCRFKTKVRKISKNCPFKKIPQNQLPFLKHMCKENLQENKVDLSTKDHLH